MPLLLFVASTKIIQLNYRNATLLPTAVQAHGAAKKKLFNYHATAISGRSPDGGFLRLRLFLCLILPTAFLPPFDELNRWTTVWINELVKNAFNVFLMTCQVGTHPPTKSVAPAAAKAAAKSKGHPFFYSSNLFCFVLVTGTLKPIPAQLVAQERRVKSSFSSRLSWFLSTSIKRMIFFCECIVAFHI